MSTVDIRPDDRLITPPVLWPLDLAEVKKARRFTTDSLDTLFDLWMQAATQIYEEETGYQLITAERELVLDGFPDGTVIEIPRPPLQGVISVKYLDNTGTEQTMSTADYVVPPVPSGVHPARGRVALVEGASWPTTVTQAGSVRVRYLAGYGDVPNDVPAIVKYALLMLVGHCHKYGEEMQEARTARTTINALPIGATSVMRAARLANTSERRPVRTVWA